MRIEKLGRYKLTEAISVRGTISIKHYSAGFEFYITQVESEYHKLRKELQKVDCELELNFIQVKNNSYAKWTITSNKAHKAVIVEDESFLAINQVKHLVYKVAKHLKK